MVPRCWPFLVLVFASSGSAQEESRLAGSRPLVVTVWKLDKEKGTVELLGTRTKMISYQLVKEVVKDGKAEKITRTAYKEIPYRSIAKFNLGDLRARGGEGRPIPEKEIWGRLAIGESVLLSLESEEVDARYFKILKKDGVIFEVRRR
jgi:hypothetical protein